MFAVALLFLVSAAHADLFRWVDPETGSVKFSNTPPPWYERGQGPKVEVIPSAERTAPPPLAEMQARWREMLLTMSAQPTPEGARAFAQLTAELDRADPAGAQRRKQELANVMRQVQQR